MDFKKFLNSVHFIKLMSFLAFWLHCAMFASFSVLLPAMVHPPNLEKYDCPHRNIKTGAAVEWTQSQQGYVTAGYGFGYFVAQLASAPAVNAFGSRWVVLVATLLGGLTTTLLTPAAYLSWIAVLAARMLTGIGGGVVSDSIYALMDHWVPPKSKINFLFIKSVSMLLGVAGSWIICGALMKVLNWSAIPFVIGGIAIAWSIVWALLVHNDPTRALSDHSDVRKEEDDPYADYLPLGMIFTSCPFVALVLLYYSDMWGLTLFFMIIPKFIFDVLTFDIFTTSLVCSLAVFCRFACGMLLQLLVRAILKYDCLDITSVRKMFVFHSHLLAGVSVMMLGFIGCNASWQIGATCFTMLLSGVSSVTSQANARDLSPAYVRTLFVVMHFLGLTSTFIQPNFLGVFLTDKYYYDGWKNIFYLTGAIYIVSGVLFLIFGSGDVQPWNFPHLYVVAQSSKLKRTDRDRRKGSRLVQLTPLAGSSKAKGGGKGGGRQAFVSPGLRKAHIAT